MLAQWLAKLFGTNNARQLRALQPLVARVNSLEAAVMALDDERLAAKTVEFRERLDKGEKLDDLLPEAYAVVREVSRRRLGKRHFDVQIMGGIVLHHGKIAEMKTGEGKTLTAALSLYLNALTGKGSHLITVNDYLARRDAQWMGPIYEFLGLRVGILQHSLGDSARKEQYAADILYATNNELGFDYLRDNMKFRLQDYVQRDPHYAIVDEVDSILIDEARTPLIISGPSDQEGDLYEAANRAVARLTSDDYEIDLKVRSVQLTESGNDKIEQFFKVDNLYAIENINLLHHVMQALKAHAIFKRDVDYVVIDNKVLIVDEFTGRILHGRRYSDSLHQALEAKEGVPVEQETQTLASITLPNYFRLYHKLAGMTGTAMTEAEEFHKIYNLAVVSIPTNQPMIREDKPDLIFLSKGAKYSAIVEDIKERHGRGQPVLIGTVAVETSELLSTLLNRTGITHQVLNAKQHEREAEIIEHAGEPGCITIATNMAGRGTDIRLTSDSRALGGLYILGTERHESRRIDNQLRGRSGRQGDPGESRFYLSLEDDLIKRFAGESLRKNMERVGMEESEIIESRFISKMIERAQEKVEKYNFEIRKNLLEYDDVLNQQRTVIYQYRRDVLEGDEQVSALIRDLIVQSVQDFFALHVPSRTIDPEQFDLLMLDLRRMTGLSSAIFEQEEFSAIVNVERLQRAVIEFLLNVYSSSRGKKNQVVIQNAEKWLLLETIDQAWKHHMLNLDHLKEGIGLRGWGQKNPLIEYKREAFMLFEQMMINMRRLVVHHIFHLDVERFNERELESKRERELDQISRVSSQGAEQVTEARAGEKTGRNEPCICGSGKKYKRCCGASQ